MKEIPDGFIQIGIILTFNDDKKIKIVENHILRMVWCSHYVFYSKQKCHKDESSNWYEFKFYCRPQDESIVSYQIGVFSNAMFNYYSKKEIKNANHTVPEDFPNCILIELNN